MNKINLQLKIEKYQLPLTYLLFLLLSVLPAYIVLIKGGQLFTGDDLDFHIARIEGLVLGFENGDFFPRINFYINSGMGYAADTFYPSIFLYPAALFRLVGLSKIQAYTLFVVVVNYGTFYVAFRSFDWIIKSRKKALLFALLYGLSTYRLTDVFYRAAVGEYLAIVFIPFAFASLYQLVWGSYNRWYMLSIAMVCIFYAHTLSTVIIGMFFFGLFIMNVSQFIKDKRRFLALLYAVVLFLGLTLVYLAPMLEQILFQRLTVQDTPAFFLQKTAGSFSRYFNVIKYNIGPNNLGAMVPLLLILIIPFTNKISKVNKQLVALGFIFLWMSSSHFPHSLFHQTFFNSIQFPWRYFIIVSFCVSWVIADSISKVITSAKLRIVFTVILLAGLLFSTIDLLVKETQFERRQWDHSSFNKYEFDTSMGYGKEFLPSNISNLVPAGGILSTPPVMKMTDMNRSYHTITLNYQTDTESKIFLPFIYYKGYKAKVVGEGKVSEVHDGTFYRGNSLHGSLEIIVTGKGKLTVWYAGTLIQKISLYLSLITWITLAFFIQKENINKIFPFVLLKQVIKERRKI